MARRDIALDKGVNLVVLGIPSGSVPASFVSTQLSRRFPGRTAPEEHLNIVSLGLIDDRDFGGDVFRMEKDSVGARLLAACVNQFGYPMKRVIVIRFMGWGVDSLTVNVAVGKSIDELYLFVSIKGVADQVERRL